VEIFSDEICYRLQEMVKEKGKLQGTVHSVFNRVCNISFKDCQIISLILGSIPIKPMAISLNTVEINSMHDLGLEQGQRVIFEDDILRLPEANLEVNISEAKPVNCSPVFDNEKEDIHKVEAKFLELPLILQRGNCKGLLPVISEFDEISAEKFVPNRYSEFALPRINTLMQAIKSGVLEKIIDSSRGIAGFGPGLTPSSDDMIIGLMISMIYAAKYYGFPEGYVNAINTALLKGAEGRTNQLSYEMMFFAAKGEVTSNLHQLMSSIYFKSDKNLYDSVLEVMDYGETSGSDMLLGIYLGCRICADLKLTTN
jgi:hypothetical protein